MTDDKGRSALYRFGVFELDSRTGELRKQGLRLRVRGRPIDVLLLLLERPGDIVTRDELRERLWPKDTFVDFDHGLHSVVNRLRDALGDSADNPRFIETLPRRGYRFIGVVTAATPEPATPAAIRPDATRPESPTPEASRMAASAPATAPPGVATPLERWPALAAPRRLRSRPRAIVTGLLVAAAASAAAYALLSLRSSPSTPGKTTMAVLPFENLSGDPEQDFFSDGFTEEVISALGMLAPDRLNVIGRTTSMLYKNARKSIGTIGEELGAAYLLEGSVRRSGSRMRITAQLVDTKSMAQIWSESYERDVGDVLEVQADVARQIARSVAPTLASPGAASTPAYVPPFAAFELYMRGRFFRAQANEEGARRAIEYYQRAIAADPGYAAAYAAIADAYRLLGAPGLEVEPPTQLLPQAKAAAERALELDPRSPEAHAALAMIKFNFDWDVAAAHKEIIEAIRLNPSFAQAHQYHSGILTAMGRVNDAIDAARRGMELDPLSATAGTTLGVRYYYANRPQEAIDQFTKTLEVIPGFAVAHWGLAQAYRLQGRFQDQIDELKRAVQFSSGSSYMRAHLGYGYAVAGDRASAEAIRRELQEEARMRYVAPYHFALIAVGLGEAAEAMDWLERAHADRSGWLVFLAVEPEFEPMRHRPEFQRLLATLGR